MVFVDSESLTSILGWVSIACWIVVYSPQIYENYSLKSGEGLSVAFVIVWLAGDLCNLVGAVLADLLSTVIILALYYSLCDIILLCQVFYYRWLNHYRTKRHQKRALLASPSLNPSTIQRQQSLGDERSPLLTPTSETSAPYSIATTDSSSSSTQLEAEESTKAVVIKYTLALVFVCVTGVLGWYVSDMVNKDGGGGDRHHGKSKTPEWIIQTLGWASAVAYLGARIPQIAKNRKTHCEGLSPALFYFAIVGNLTYAASIVTASSDWDYLVTNGGWLAGSALTVFLDMIVLGQFFFYRSMRRSNARLEQSLI